MSVSAIDVQVRLKNLGFYQGKIDGDLGPATREAIIAALSGVQAILPEMAVPGRHIPEDWLQPADIARIHLHWTAGGHKASENDRAHYHVLIEANGKVIRGLCDISGNSTTSPKGRKASHTLNANTGAVAVSMCCMQEAQERPFMGGKYPLTKEQWDRAAEVVAELCRRYKVPVTPRTVLSHAEVQANLGIKQRGKWDIAILPFDTTYDTARECGDRFREQVQEHLRRLS